MAVSETRVTRGGLLKRAGAGAAAFGAGSMLTASTAGASLPASTVCVDIGCEYESCPGGSGCCYCTINRDGCCNCFENMFCAGLPTCTSGSQCPPGWACQANTCGQVGVCVGHCGTISHHTAGCLAPNQVGIPTTRSSTR
jgi:hypothetical protein